MLKSQLMRVLILTLFAAGCALAQKVTVEFDQAADFSRYKTFAIRDGQLNSRNPALNSELVKKRIDADIERDLTARGLSMVSGQSDLNVRYRLGSARKTELESYPAGWRGWGTRVVRVPYTEGTLVIDLRDPVYPLSGMARHRQRGKKGRQQDRRQTGRHGQEVPGEISA